MKKLSNIIDEINQKYAKNNNILNITKKISNHSLLKKENESLEIDLNELKSLFKPEDFYFERQNIGNLGVKLT
jgi:hypothetical protein